MEAINSSDMYMCVSQYCSLDLYLNSLQSVDVHWNRIFNVYLESSNL